MGAYSNGYDLAAVHTALATRVGFRQPVGSGVPTLSIPVTQSDGGRYYQDFHTMVTVQNIKATMEQVGASDSDLNTYLQNLKKACIQRCLNGVFGGPEIIEQVKLFTRYGMNDQLITNSGLFVGYEIDVAASPDTAVQIDAVHFLMNGAATFNLYLFKDGSPAALWTQSITTVQDTVTEQVLADKVLGPGKYYLGYFQGDLGPIQAYREQVDCWEPQCRFGAVPMQAAATGATTLNRNERQYPSEPLGFNVEISSFIDHTLQIKRKAAMFDELQGLTMAYMVIEQIIYAVRWGGNERILKDNLDKVGIQLDLNGAAAISDSPQVTGLKQRIDRELKTVKESFYPKPKARTVSLC